MPWILDGSPGLTTKLDVVTYRSASDRLVPASALWADGDPIKSGESYWTVKFGHLTDGAFVGVTSRDRLAPGYGTRGLFYGGNLSNGICCLVGEFGPEIKSKDLVGLLVSFTRDQSLQIFIYLNGRPLGLVFEVSAPVFPNGVYPTVQFYEGKGSAKIQKETTVPTDRTRRNETFSGIEGTWKTEAGSIKIDGQAPQPSLLPTIKFYHKDGNKYEVSLQVVNNISFSIKKTERSWKNRRSCCSTLMGSSPECLQLEDAMTKLCYSPDSVSVDTSGRRMTVNRKNSTVTFVRYDDTPSPYSGNPFRF